MNISLTHVQPDGTQRDFPLKKAVQVIGRQTDCQLRIPSSNVSRHHCELTVTEAGDITIRDLGSSNGTFVNKQKVTTTSLSAGDFISLGGLVFVVRIDGKPSFIDSDDVLEDGLVPITGSSTGSESRPTASTSIGNMPKPPHASPKGAANAKPSKPLVSSDPDDSSVADFDFLDDNDLDDQPKL